MPVQLNHTIVNASDKHASARFLSDILGRPEPTTYGPFVVVRVDNDVELDFIDAETVHPQHYAFLVDEAEFDAAFARIRGAGLSWYADPFQRRPGEINHELGGRGLYFCDPDGHNMELLTVAEAG